LAGLELFSPTAIVFQREDHLDRFRTAGTGYTESLKRLPDLAKPGIGVLWMMGWGSIDPV